ncbi:ATP-dependent RNA helicase [Serendipita sp. 396]|nr:ATP-dependent RNA helicase [Serendipita sp. 396]KAG8788881.1 ATP-dependent RNA helicase [Serendipita sp. 397]KAG8828800.1 ATP-dependent RNA helicase [Serendipita sp. 401]KAG9058678.1 ATP-dependent RNA helicase [Serendipita sp. 407]
MTSKDDELILRKLSQRRDLKRKLNSKSNHRPVKKQKTIGIERGLEDLDWRVVNRPSAAGIDEAGGMLMLEEVEGVDVYYEETSKGKVAKFKQVMKLDRFKDNPRSPTLSQGSGDMVRELNEELEQWDPDDLPAWSSFALHPAVLRQLQAQGFTTPTEIQKETLTLSMQGRDVIGVAQTGSGKTLAFGLPVLHHILSQQSLKGRSRRIKALIITPTRELALQVTSHLNSCAPQRSEQQLKAQIPPRVSIAAIVGGLSSQKQARLIERGADIIVATPGRLWELLSQSDSLATQIRNIRFLVLDEADRMIENGHFAELDNILRLTSRPDPTSIEAGIEAFDLHDDEEKGTTQLDQMQTFVFSATMNKDLQRNLKRFQRTKRNEKGSTVDDLLLRLDFRDAQPAVIDLSPQGGVVSTFQESRVECLSTDKDMYLYYFLLRYPGRSLVFLSSIDGVRRLAPLLSLLDIHAWPIHSQMQQKQRLKNLDRFKNSSNCVLLATDIAARGLDIPFVDHVIHYQIPRSGDVYIHRNGRTARAERPGFGLLLVAPEERKLLRSILGNLGRKDEELADLPVERDLLDHLKERVQVAREIDKIQHSTTKENHEKHWLKVTAEALELDISDGDAELQNEKKNQATIKSLKLRLQDLLEKPLVARGISKKFITSGSRPIVDDLLHGQNHKTMLGLRVVTAQGDVAERRKTTRGKRIAKHTKHIPDVDQ